MKKTILALVAAISAAGAHAATVSFDFGLPLTEATTEISPDGTLGLFDSSLGTLTGASIQVFGGATFSFSGTNNAAQTQNANITSSTDLIWNTSLAALAPFLSDALSLSASSGIQSYASGETKNFGPIADADNSSDNLSTILASLQAVGGGNFNIGCDSLSGLSVQGGGGNIATTQSTQAGCGATITYEYTVTPTDVPEPASLLLVGLGLMGAATARRRKL